MRYIRERQARRQGLEFVTEVLESPYLVSLWQQGSELQQKETELRSTFGDRHPQIQNVQVEKRNLDVKLDNEINRIVDNISNEISVLAEKERAIQADIDVAIGKKNKAGQAEVELRQLERQADADRRLYEEFLQRFKETKEQEDIVQPNARVIAWAEEPEVPSSIPPGNLILAGFLASTGIGLGLAWLTERLDNRVRSGKQIEAAFNLPCLGLIPLLRTGNKRGRASRPHLYLLDKPLSAYAETIRAVHTALRMGTVDHPLKVIQVTSSVPGEGKTVFAVSLATLLAQSGYRTLLLDLDLRHPSVHREIHIPAQELIAAYVLGEIDRAKLVHHDEETGLDVIALKRPLHNPAMILASQKLRDLVQRLRGEYDYVVVDSTPVLGVSDSKITAELVDAIIFVVRWGQTTFDMPRDSLKELGELNLPVRGTVITQVRFDRLAHYGYGGIDNHYIQHSKYYQN